MSKMFSSLRFRLTLLVLLATLPALALTVYNGYEQRRFAEADASDNAYQLVQFAASKNELLIEDTRVILISLSHAMDFAGDGLQSCGHLLNHLKDVHFPFYSAFYVADLDGNILCSMPNGDVPEDLLGCQHYQSLIASDDFVVSEYHICRNTGKGVISMGYPIWDDSEQKIGVINVGIDLMWFNDFAVQAELSPGSDLVVFDRDGIILAQYPEPDVWVGKTMPDDSVRDVIFHEKQGTTRGVGADSVERLYAFMPLSGSENSVFIALSIPTSYAFADVERNTVRNLVLISAVTLAALLAAWFLGEAFLVRSINNLVDTTKRLANGDLSARTHAIYDRGEFGVLNQSIDEMAEALSQRELDRRQAEDEIREYAASLERSNRDLTDFANITSHDLQEPLRKISTFSDLLLTRHANQLDAQGQDYLNRIHASASRMQSLIIDLLTYSRISTKMQPLEQVALDVVIQEVMNDLELQIEQSQAAITIENLSPVYADPVQMHQLFLNLISNSLKFRKPDIPAVVNIEGRQVPISVGFEGNGFTSIYEIKVSDNGIGFDEKYRNRIFQPFQRLHAREDYEGTGMGLAICRKIVERHGGDIQAHSKPGQGTTFIIKFPISSGEGDNQ